MVLVLACSYSITRSASPVKLALLSELLPELVPVGTDKGKLSKRDLIRVFRGQAG